MAEKLADNILPNIVFAWGDIYKPHHGKFCHLKFNKFIYRPVYKNVFIYYYFC